VPCRQYPPHQLGSNSPFPGPARTVVWEGRSREISPGRCFASAINSGKVVTPRDGARRDEHRLLGHGADGREVARNQQKQEFATWNRVRATVDTRRCWTTAHRWRDGEGREPWPS
jgi:hypothetical protein